MKTKIILAAIAFAASTQLVKAQNTLIQNNSFRLNPAHGDLEMRRYSNKDNKWKRALVPSQKILTINYDGDFVDGVSVSGKKLYVEKMLTLNAASNQSKNSPSIVLQGVEKDNFLYDGKYLNHYGIGFHDFKDNSKWTLNGNNLYLSGYFGVDLFTGGQNRLRINNNGNVGIGTIKPDNKLTVNGKVHCKEVKVDLNVPADYVFEKYYTGTSALKNDYKMPSLEEVEAFTKQNNHLPSIPSAKQIKEEGLHLKEMTNLLLQKIEELTLYTIEQEKEIKKLKEQEKEITKLKVLVNQLINK